MRSIPRRQTLKNKTWGQVWSFPRFERDAKLLANAKRYAAIPWHAMASVSDGVSVLAYDEVPSSALDVHVAAAKCGT